MYLKIPQVYFLVAKNLIDGYTVHRDFCKYVSGEPECDCGLLASKRQLLVLASEIEILIDKELIDL